MGALFVIKYLRYKFRGVLLAFRFRESELTLNNL